MTGNATHRFANTAILTVQTADASQVVTSAAFDEQLGDTYQRVGLRPGLLERLAGIRERRWWPDGVSFVDGAATAGAKAISESGVDPAADRPDGQHLGQPQAPRAVHGRRGAPRARACPSSCQNFDVTNACLGFVNGMEMAGGDDRRRAGRLRPGRQRRGRPARCRSDARAARPPGRPSPRTCSRSSPPSPWARAPAAMVLGRADRHPEGHRLVGAVSRAGTEHHELCVGDNDGMRTDLKGLLDAGLRCPGSCGPTPRRVRLGRRDGPLRHPPGLQGPHPGSVRPVRHRPGPGADDVPDPRATSVRPRCRSPWPARRTRLADGDRVLLMGIGSGLNASLPGDRLVTTARRRVRRAARAGPGLVAVDHRSRLRTARSTSGTCSTTVSRDPAGTLLCVHGNPTWSYLWRRLLAAAPPGWRVVAPDQLGMGWSERLAGTADAGPAGGRPREPHRCAGRHRPGGDRGARLGRRHLPRLGSRAPATSCAASC